MSLDSVELFHHLLSQIRVGARMRACALPVGVADSRTGKPKAMVFHEPVRA